MKSSTLYSTLAFAGAIPFLACALLPFAGVIALEPIGRLDRAVSSYGLAILSFLAGIHWATFLLKQDECRSNLFISSNVVLLAVWIPFVVGVLKITLVSQIIAFVYVLSVDHGLLRSGVISTTYFRMRSIATGLAVLSLLIVLISHWQRPV